MAFTNLMIKLKREFDVLLLDSSPVGLFPDSNASATKVDDLIFVTRYSKVGRRTAKSMLQKLEETGARILVLFSMICQRRRVLHTIMAMATVMVMDITGINTIVNTMVTTVVLIRWLKTSHVQPELPTPIINCSSLICEL